MRGVGLITEYNPFHNGHLHHLHESKRLAGADVAVAVMSGHFLQRGAPALFDKWIRTELALAAGVDVVLELPFPWACNSAPHFAAGAVRSLTACGGIDTLSFGSEAGTLKPLQRCADLLCSRGDAIASQVAARLRHGENYPAARMAVFAALGEDTTVLAAPNNILAIEYLKALQEQGSPLQPLTIPRIGAGYHDAVPAGGIASASGIRALHAAGAGILPYLPSPCHPVVQRALRDGRDVDTERFWGLVAGRLLTDPSALAATYQMEPGLAARLHTAALTATSLDQLALTAKARHLTLTRVQRLLCYTLLAVEKSEMQAALATGPRYLRLLGHSQRGARFLAATRKERSLPLLGNLSRAVAQLRKFYGPGTPRGAMAMQQLALDLRATRLYTLLLRHWQGARNRDYYEEVRRWE